MIYDKTMPIFGLPINPPEIPDDWVECRTCGEKVNQALMGEENELDVHGDCLECRIWKDGIK